MREKRKKILGIALVGILVGTAIVPIIMPSVSAQTWPDSSDWILMFDDGAGDASPGDVDIRDFYYYTNTTHVFFRIETAGDYDPTDSTFGLVLDDISLTAVPNELAIAHYNDNGTAKAKGYYWNTTNNNWTEEMAPRADHIRVNNGTFSGIDLAFSKSEMDEHWTDFSTNLSDIKVVAYVTDKNTSAFDIGGYGDYAHWNNENYPSAWTDDSTWPPYEILDHRSPVANFSYICECEYCEDGVKPRALPMEYTAENCSACDHHQDPGKVSCTTYFDPLPNDVYIIATDKDDPNHHDAKIWFEGNVSKNGEFSIDATNAGETKLKAETRVFIYTDYTCSTLVQEIKFHTSCSQPLIYGDQYGSLILVGFVPDGDGGEVEGYGIQFFDSSYDGDGYIVNWTWDFGDGNTSYQKNTTHQYTNEGIYNVNLTVTDDDGLTDSIIKQITVPCSCGGCDDDDDDDDDDYCEDGEKPCALTMNYTGEDCSASNHSQDPKKVSCDGDPAFASPVRIIATDKKNPGDKKAKIWFNDTVNLDEEFTINATNAGETKLKATTYVFIYNATTGNLLQTIMFHTSCSQPLVYGDQYGSLILVGFVPESGCCGDDDENCVNCCCDCGSSAFTGNGSTLTFNVSHGLGVVPCCVSITPTNFTMAKCIWWIDGTDATNFTIAIGILNSTTGELELLQPGDGEVSFCWVAWAD